MIYATERFVSKFEKDDDTSKSHLVYALRDLASEKVSTKNRNFLSEGRLGRVSRDLGFLIRKERLSAKGRILFYRDSGNLHLIDYDWNHSSVQDLESKTTSNLKILLTNLTEKPELEALVDRVSQGGAVATTVVSGTDRDTYVEELGDEWIRFLDTEQQQVCDTILGRIVSKNEHEVFLILGGAGTGKTMVLLDLAWRLLHEEDFPVQLKIPQGVREYLAKSEDEYWFQRATDGNAILFDDPSDFDAMDAQIKNARRQSVPIVVAIDPTQWTHKTSRAQFSRLLSQDGVEKFELSLAYRQGGVVGRNSLKIASDFYSTASMYSSDENVSLDRARAQYWEDLCLRQPNHVDDKGHYSVHDISNPKQLFETMQEELRGVATFQTYRRWPKLLVGSGEVGKLPKGAWEALETALGEHGITHVTRALQEVEKVRGTEYEAVFVFLTQRQHQNLLTGPTGLDRIRYTELTQPLTFLTRAENRLAIFVLPEGFPYVPAKTKP